jgi:hypothetical protein
VVRGEIRQWGRLWTARERTRFLMSSVFFQNSSSLIIFVRFYFCHVSYIVFLPILDDAIVHSPSSLVIVRNQVNDLFQFGNYRGWPLDGDGGRTIMGSIERWALFRERNCIATRRQWWCFGTAKWTRVMVGGTRWRHEGCLPLLWSSKRRARLTVRIEPAKLQDAVKKISLTNPRRQPS